MISIDSSWLFDRLLDEPERIRNHVNIVARDHLARNIEPFDLIQSFSFYIDAYNEAMKNAQELRTTEKVVIRITPVHGMKVTVMPETSEQHNS